MIQDEQAHHTASSARIGERLIILSTAFIIGLSLSGVTQGAVLSASIVFVALYALASEFGIAYDLDRLSEGGGVLPRMPRVSEAALRVLLIASIGVIPVIPYLFLETGQAFSASVLSACVAVFVLRYSAGVGAIGIFSSLLVLARMSVLAVLAGVIAHLIAG